MSVRVPLKLEQKFPHSIKGVVLNTDQAYLIISFLERHSDFAIGDRDTVIQRMVSTPINKSYVKSQNLVFGA